MKKEILEKIRQKRELSQIPEKDIELVYEKFSKRQINEEDKIDLTKESLRKIFTAFVSRKLLSLKDKDPKWILRKHISTKERLPYYPELYGRIFKDFKNVSVIDLGAGINGFSFDFFPKNKKISYFGIEAVGQLVDLMNFHFKKNKLNGRVIHISLFELDKIKRLIKEQDKPRIVFMFKVIDALEVLKRNYSKELISEIIGSVDLIVLSFATKSLGKRKSFFAKRNWILDFIKENFNLLGDFELGGERYMLFHK